MSELKAAVVVALTVLIAWGIDASNEQVMIWLLIITTYNVLILYFEERQPTDE